MRSEKTYLVDMIGSFLKESDYVYFVSYKGLTVKQLSSLRDQLANSNAVCHVLKNTLIKKAAELSEISALSAMDLKDSTAMVFGKGDPSVVAKVLLDFSKTNEALCSKGGYFEGALLTANEVGEIAALPPKEVLYAQLLGVLNGPARNLVSVLNNKAASILNVLNAYKDKLETK